MADEQSLPPLPAVSWNPTTQTIRTRKRARDNDTAHPTTSSDPAFFSSDDDPSVENYAQGRRKKRYVGSWFSQHPTSSDSTFSETRVLPKPTREFKRQFDSGVWMGSDSGTDIDDILETVETPTRSRLPLNRLARPSISGPEHLARDRIRDCLDQGNESIDLSSLSLDSLSNETITPLSEFACIPIVEKGVAFEQKEPALKLYLSGNFLPNVPGALFNLEFLTVLSLRGNRITELSPAISNLRNLEELNVSQNSLRYLPAELLDLVSPPGNLKKLYIHPNPFCQPAGDGNETLLPENFEDVELVPGREEHEGVMGLEETKLEEYLVARFDVYQGCSARILARSPVQFNDSAGVLHSSFEIGPAPGLVDTEDLETQPTPPVFGNLNGSASSQVIGSQPTRVPSLFELALHACYNSSQLAVIPSLLPEHTSESILGGISRAIKQKAEGGMQCTVCKRLIVRPRTEWIEWWEIAKVEVENTVLKLEPLSRNRDERAVPFIRRGCSWKCLPDKVTDQWWLVE